MFFASTNKRTGHRAVARPVKADSNIVIWCGAVLLVLALGLLIPIPYAGRWTHGLGDLMHAPVFACVTLVLLNRIDRVEPFRVRRVVRVVSVCLGLLVFGILTELAQKIIGRNASLHDAAANALGIAAATSWYLSVQPQGDRPASSWRAGGLRLAAAVFLVTASWQPAMRVGNLIADHWARTTAITQNTG